VTEAFILLSRSAAQAELSMKTVMIKECLGRESQLVVVHWLTVSYERIDTSAGVRGKKKR
jgi:hypothetical protein